MRKSQWSEPQERNSNLFSLDLLGGLNELFPSVNYKFLKELFTPNYIAFSGKQTITK